MSKQGHFGSTRNRDFQGSGPSRGGRGGNYAGRGGNYAGRGPVNGLANSMYNNEPSVHGLFEQPPPLPRPKFNVSPAGANTPYQITVSINPTAFPGNAPQIAPHPSQFGPPMNQYGPPLPSPYTPYEHYSPPPGDLSSVRLSTPSFDQAGRFEDERSKSGQVLSGTGNRSRMRGNFSKSMNYLDKKSHDMASPNARGRGFSQRARGAYENTKHQSKSNQSHLQEDGGDFDDNGSDCSNLERNYNKSNKNFPRGARGGRYNTGVQNARGQRGKYDGRHNGEERRRSAAENDIQERGRQESNCENDEANDSDTATSEASHHQGKSCNQRGRGRSNNTGKNRGCFGGHNRGAPEKSAFGNSDDDPCVHDKKERILQESEQQGGARPKTLKAEPMKTSSQMVEELDVSLHFKMCFEKASTLKAHVRSAHEISQDTGTDFTLSCVEIYLKHMENKADCKLTISGSNIAMAKEHVHKIVSILKQKLDTPINFELGKPKKENARDVNRAGSYEHEKKSPQNAEGENVNSSKKRRAKKKEQDTTKSSETCLPVETIVSLKVGKHFSSHAGFKTFVINATTSLKIHLQIDDNSISLSREFSTCEIKTKSKADARRLTKLFDELHKVTQLNVEISTCSAETILKKAKFAMTMKKSELIQKHEEKISQIEKNLRKLECTQLSRDTKTDIYAINCKISEARKHQKEFLSCYDALYREMGNILSSAKADDIVPLQTLFDMECNRFNMACPVYAYRTEIIQQVKSSQVSIFVGENGCGKSTQIVQYLFDAGVGNDGVIVCTQPEQLATVALAEKVAKEQSVKVGSFVECRTGRNSGVDDSTKILFATDHWLLNECLVDPTFKKYSCIIVNEAHQRSVHTDLLLGMIKSCLPLKQDFKVIIISSPSEADIFKEYFGTGQALAVDGQNFAVNVFHSHDSSKDFKDYKEKAVSKAITIHTNEDEGHILAFVSLPTETHQCCQEFERIYNGLKSFECMPLHSQLPPDELRKIFKSLPDGQRKIVFATKFAETSFAFDGVRYVIDTGVTSDIKYDAEEKVNVTKTCKISQTSANFRKNCAGHAIGGSCYRLYSRENFNALEAKFAPEIIRVHLKKALLKLLELGVDFNTFDFVQAPSHLALKIAMETLQQYEAIFGDQITETGKWISKVPFDPRLGFFIFEAGKNDLLYDAVVLSAIVTFGGDMSYRNVSETNSEVYARNKENFDVLVVDSFVWLQVYKKWSETPKNKRSKWCQSNSVNYKLMNSVCYCVKEVMSILLNDFHVKCNSVFSSKEEWLTALKRLYMRCKCKLL